METVDNIIIERQHMNESQIAEVKGSIKARHEHSGHPSPITIYICSDGKEFHHPDHGEAFNHERRLWIAARLIQKYHQKKAEVTWWNILSRTISGNGAFSGCYWIKVPVDSFIKNFEHILEEIQFLHPMINRNDLRSTLWANKAGYYLISYGDVHIYGLHKLESTTINITPIGIIQSKLAQLQLELKEMVDNG